MSFGAVAASYVAGLGNGSGASLYRAAVLEDNPLAFYKLDELSGTTMADSSGNGRDGAYINSPHLGQHPILSGDDGYSVDFEADDSNSANVPYASWMDATAMTITTACIVQPAALRIIASRYSDVGDNWSWFLYTDNSKFMFYYRTSGGVNHRIDSGVTVSPGRKYFVSAYVGAAEAGLRVYDDTGLIASPTGPGATLNPSPRNLVLADCDPPNQYPMIGYLDGVAYFGSALSTARLDELASYVLAPTTIWLNRAAGVSARNGTANHTLSFTPTSAGSLLIAVVSIPDTTGTASTPGWTKRFGANYNTELSVFTRSANAGDASLVIATAMSDVPLHYVVYEFPSGSAWHSSVTVTDSGVYTQLAGLPGTPVAVFGALSARRLVGEVTVPSVDWQYFWKTDFVQDTPYDGARTGVFTGIGYIGDLRDTATLPIQNEEFIEADVPFAQRVLFALTLP